DGVEAVGIEVAEDARGIAAEQITPRLELRGVDVEAALEEPAPLDATLGVELDAALRVEPARAARGVGLLHVAELPLGEPDEEDEVARGLQRVVEAGLESVGELDGDGDAGA